MYGGPNEELCANPRLLRRNIFFFFGVLLLMFVCVAHTNVRIECVCVCEYLLYFLCATTRNYTLSSVYSPRKQQSIIYKRRPMPERTVRRSLWIERQKKIWSISRYCVNSTGILCWSKQKCIQKILFMRVFDRCDGRIDVESSELIMGASLCDLRRLAIEKNTRNRLFLFAIEFKELKLHLNG